MTTVSPDDDKVGSERHNNLGTDLKNAYPVVVEFIRRRVSSLQVAENLTGQTILSYLAYIKKYPDKQPENLLGFLVNKAKHNLASYYAACERRPVEELYAELEEREQRLLYRIVDSVALDVERRVDLERAIAKELTSDERRALTLRAVDGLSFEQIGFILNKHKSRAYQLVTSATGKLRGSRLMATYGTGSQREEGRK